jgi:translation elongation factor EF-Ts
LIRAVESCKGDFVAKFKTFHRFATEFARDNTDLSLVFNTLLNEIVGTNTLVEKLAKASYERYRRVIENILEEGKRDGSVKPEIDAALYAHIVIASHTGMLVAWLVNRDALDVRAFVNAFRDLILKGVTDCQ